MSGTRSFTGRSRLVEVLGLAVLLTASVAPAGQAGPAPELDDPRLRTGSPRFTLGSLETAGRDAPRKEVPSSRELGSLRARPSSETGFVRSYLLPRLSSRFDGLAPRHPIVDGPQERVDHLLYDSLTDAARRSAERGARDALKNFLIDTTSIGRLFGRKGDGPPTGSVEGAPAERSPRARSDFGVGVSGGRPEVEWRYRSDNHALRLRVDVDGRAGLSFSRSRLNETHLSLAYNPHRAQYSLFFSLGF